ncbi:MAG: 3-hydroxyacyl-CoA dehydrogenase NAD-binding domain-containing protein [Syntrophomonadales bacterium]
MKVEDIKRILIIGSGTMGRHIGLQHALYGYEVVFYDIDEKVLQVATTHIGKIAGRLLQSGFISEEMHANVEKLITTTTDPQEASKGVQVVSESVPENIPLKQKVWSEFDKYLPQDAILTTNTSTLVASMFAEASGRPERFLAWHFHLPVFTANVVDVMPHAGTDPELTQVIIEHSKKINQIPIDIRVEWPHYVYNELLTALQGAALRLAVNNVASVEDIDRAWMAIMGTKIGPFGIMDSVGLDTNYHITAQDLELHPDTPYLKEIVQFLKAKVDANELGRKTGKGFYSYPNPAYEQSEFLERVKPKFKK